jgi:hypothetical protein
MNHSVNSRKSAARTERLQQRVDAGFVSAHFPEVDSIVINMLYSQRGIQKSLPRIVNFFPGSYALFRIDCLNKDCVDGGFDLTEVITAMIRNRRGTAKGELSCVGNGSSADHSAIVYEVTIQYS